MASLSIRPITRVRDSIYSEVDAAGVTAITRSGRFVGLLISTGPLPAGQSKRLLDGVRHNPEHTLGRLTQKALG